MIEFPSISSHHVYTQVIAFDKLDGSNIRAEWTRKLGFSKFGRRNGLLDDSNPNLLVAKDLIPKIYGESLSQIFQREGYQKVTCFFELFGPNSFAGHHCDEPSDMRVVLFDVHHKHEFLPARKFLKLFQDKVEIPNVCYDGKWNKELTQQVNNGVLSGMTFEGVVCKGARQMFKVKNYAWYDRVRAKYGEKAKELF